MISALISPLRNPRFWAFIALSILTVTSSFANRNIKFSVDMSLMVTQGKFNPSTDAVYIKGTLNNWGQTDQLIKGTGNIYSVTLSLADNSYHEYKYFITTANAGNSGWENNFPVAQSGNRIISIGVKDLTLAAVFYNDGEHHLKKTTPNFVFHYSAQDEPIIEEFSVRTEKFLEVTSKSLQSFPTKPTDIYFYKDLDQLHMAQGYPENTGSSVGSAYGTSLFIMLSPSKMVFNDALSLFAHEFTHCLNAWKTKIILPAWLNEGVACYYSRMYSSKDWIKNDILAKGKPNIEDVFKGNMGYAYSGTIAYYIIKTKGEAAMAKFIENMNYADIGYLGLPALQTGWHAFLDNYLDYQTTVNVKFSVDMADMIAAKYFSPTTDKVYLRGSWSNWANRQMTLQSGTVYSITLPHNIYNSLYEYKFYTNSPTAPNGGLEQNVDESVSGNRLLDVEGTAKTLPVVKFHTLIVPVIDMKPIENKIGVLKHHGLRSGTPAFSTFNYPFKIISAAEYEAQKPADNLPFDAGFVAPNGIIHVCVPTSEAQKAIFPDISKAALYYLCQSYMYYFYQTREMPLIFKVGFAAYESGLNPADSIVKKAVSAFGNTFDSFDVLNNPTTFTANNGFAIAGAFGEFMNIFKNWGYPNILTIHAGSFDVAPWWWNVNSLSGLLGDFNRYVYARFLEPVNNLRIQKVLETDHFRFYTRPVDAALNFPYFSDVLEPAYVEYTTNFKVKAYEKFSYFTLPTCVDEELEGVSCNGLPPERITGGTAWSSGVHSTCASTADQLPMFYGMNRHEFAHAIQGIMPQGIVTAWLNEGFPTFCSDGPITQTKLAEIRDQGKNALKAGMTYFGHRPTYEDTRVYPNPDYGYYTMGYFLNDYIYRRGSYQLLKDVQMNDLAAYQSLGYATAQAFLEDFYFDFDVTVQEKPMVRLDTLIAVSDVNASFITFKWTPLNASVKLNVSVSTDGGISWSDIATKTMLTSCTWNAGNFTGKFSLKFTAPDHLSLTETYGPFSTGNLNIERGIKVTFKRPADWGTSGVHLWAWTSSGNLFTAWPGTPMTDAGNGWFSYTFDETVKNVNVIFSRNGTPQTVDILGVTQSTCFQSDALQNGKITVTAVSCTTGNTALELPDGDEPRITVYPQPASSRFMVKLYDGSDRKEYEMSIIDLSGRIIRQSVFTSPAMPVERGGLPRGLYILRLISPDTGKQYSTKLSVE